MRVFVLGGSGFVGRHVVRRLHGNGHEVVVFHRGQTRADLPAAVRPKTISMDGARPTMS